LVPAGQVEPVMATVIAEARAQTSALVQLPAGEGVVLETVPDAPWPRAVALAPTPQSVVSERIAELAPQMLLAGDGGAAFAAILRDAGVEFDLAHAVAWLVELRGATSYGY
jgi:hypothetical protein